MPTFVAAATKNDQSLGSGAGSLTGFDLNCGTGSNRCAVVCVVFDDGNTHIITGVTVGGVACTEIASEYNPPSATGVALHAWRLIAPATGAQSVVVSYADGTINRACVVVALAYEDVDQTTPIANVVTAENASGIDVAAMDVTVSSATGDLVIVFGGAATALTITCDTGTERADVNRATNGTTSGMASEQAGAASVATEHTWSANADWGAIGFSLVAAGGAPSAFSAYYQQYYQKVLA